MHPQDDPPRGGGCVSVRCRPSTGAMNVYEMLFGVAVMTAADDEGLAYLAENALQPAVVSLPSGLQYKVVSSGDALGLSPELHSRCVCHYKSSFVNGTVFDSRFANFPVGGSSNESPRNLTLVPSQSPPYILEALQLMKEGDVWSLTVPAKLSGPRAPTPGGNYSFLAELELLKVDSPSMFIIFGYDLSRYLPMIPLVLHLLYQLFFAKSENEKRKGPKLSVQEASKEEHARVFLEVQVGDARAGRMEFELFQTTYPKTTENFRALCTGEKGVAASGAKLHYAGACFHRVIPGFVCQGGDLTNQNGTGGESIYGGKFDDEFEPGVVGHTEPYLLSMANGAPHTNSSQFFITSVISPHLDGKNVVFGRLISGEAVVKAIEAVGSGNGCPYKPVTIVACGEVEKQKSS